MWQNWRNSGCKKKLISFYKCKQYNENIRFLWRDTGKLQKLTVVDERIPEVPDTPQTGINGKTVGMVVSLISLLIALGCFARVRAKDKSKYNFK